MQTTEQDLNVVAPAAPQSQPLHSDIDIDHSCELLTEEEADAIFQRAEAEVQPLMRKMRRDTFWQNVSEVFCWVCIVASIVGMVYQIITYPHTLVILYTKARPAQIATTLDVSTRTLVPVTITRSATIPTTGHGHQDAQRANGELTFFNGQLQSITIPVGTVFTGGGGIQIATATAVTIPAADSTTTPPSYGQVKVSAYAIHPGAIGNIQAFDISGSCCATSVIVKNLASFHNGQDARTFKAVAAKDLQTLTSTVNDSVTQAFTTAFPLQLGEAVIRTNCTTRAIPNHQIGEEATSVALTSVKTCSAVAYNQSQLTRAATVAFMQTRPAKNYHIVSSSVQITLQRVTPLSVIINGKWAYTFSQDYQELLAQGIQGDNPAKARAYLLKTGVISYASVPNTLASADFINFLVLVG